MFVSERMTKNVSTVTPEESVSKAFQVLKKKKYSQLPVVDEKGKLVGFITEKILTEVSPSKATSLSIFEINYLLSKTKVLDIMKTKIFTISPESLIEEAALIMKTNDIGSLPVVDDSNVLVGILTRVDVFSAFVDIMGVNEFGTRIALQVDDKLGTFADISHIIKEYGMNITHVNNYTVGEHVEIILKLNTLEIDDLLKTLEKHDYKVLSVTNNQIL